MKKITVLKPLCRKNSFLSLSAAAVKNVKLASQLLNCDIDVLTEEQEAERRTNENKVRSQRFMEALDVDEMIAHLLIAGRFLYR